MYLLQANKSSESQLQITGQSTSSQARNCYHIKPDQTGFIKLRFGTDSIRRLLNVINSTQACKLPALIISLGAEKAFDRVEWEFLFATLKKFNLGSKFIEMIKLLCASPQAYSDHKRADLEPLLH